MSQYQVSIQFLVEGVENRTLKQWSEYFEPTGGDYEDYRDVARDVAESYYGSGDLSEYIVEQEIGIEHLDEEGNVIEEPIMTEDYRYENGIE